MADPFTHIMLGMAITPKHPFLGAFFAMLPDVPQLFAAIQIKSVKIWKKWPFVPRQTRALHKHMHSIWYPLFALFLAWFFLIDWSRPWIISPMVTFVVCYLSHIVIDIFVHDRTAAFMPFIEESFSLGRTYHSFNNLKRYWWVVLSMIGGSFLLSYARGAWEGIL